MGIASSSDSRKIAFAQLCLGLRACGDVEADREDARIAAVCPIGGEVDLVMRAPREGHAVEYEVEFACDTRRGHFRDRVEVALKRRRRAQFRFAQQRVRAARYTVIIAVAARFM